MRNNEERIGSQKPSMDNSAEMEVKQDLSIPIQTEFVTLPSGGKYYPEGHPLRGKEDIEIKFMTSKEEDILTSKSLLKKGVAIDRVLQSLIVDKKIELDSLFICDKNALIIAARISGYGAGYNTKVMCPACDTSIEYNFNLEDIKTFEGDPQFLGEDGLLTFELPKTKARVSCKLLTGRDEKFISQIMENKKKHKLAETNLTDQMKLFIVSINGVVEQGEINKFVENMPSLDSRYLRKIYQDSIPGVDLNQVIECPSCEEESEVMMPLGITFFWPK